MSERSEDDRFARMRLRRDEAVRSLQDEVVRSLGGDPDELRRELIVGGLADGIPASKFDPDELAKGIKAELKEHVNTPDAAAIATATEIAKDHLTEIPDYYTRMEQMEKEAKREEGGDEHPESMSRVSDVEDFLESLDPKVLERVQVMSADECGKPALHLSRDTEIREFKPQVSSRRAEAEDSTIPRIPVATALLGCLLSRQNDESEFFAERGPKNRGGWSLYQLPYTHIVKPDSVLVGDGDRTGELWIVGFDDNHRSVTPVQVAQVFQESYKYVAKTDRDQEDPTEMVVTLFIRVLEDAPEEGISWNGEEFLTYGDYKITLYDWGHHQNKDFREYDRFYIERVSEAQYEHSKKVSAGLLSHEEDVPTSTLW